MEDPSGDATLNSVTNYTYDAIGQIDTITLPNHVTLTYHFDDARRFTGISNSLGERITYTYDPAGNRTRDSITDASATLWYTATREYDELSRVMNLIGAEGQTTHIDYDLNSNASVVTNPRLHATESDHDPLDRVTQMTDAENGVTQLAYDDMDRLTAVTDANSNVTQYDYDSYGNVIRLDSPDTGVTTYGYDSANNRIHRVDARGVITLYRYDALNRLTQVIYPSSPGENEVITTIVRAASALVV